jgi:hypothetical protein
MPGGQAMATIVLSLDTSDAHARRRLEVLYFTLFNIRRALQRDTQRLCSLYWSRKDERDELGWKFVADDLGLNRKGFEQLARGHALSSGWALDHVSQALVYHMADAVFEDAARHLWSDGSGKRHGPLNITAWHKFFTIHGRARSHTTENKWESFRLYGTLEGHLDAYGHGSLGEHPGLDQATAQSVGTPLLRQKHMSIPGPTRWKDYTGPLVMVFAGGPNSNEGELQLPVLLPQGRGQWDRVTHFLSDPESWHKINLVRRPDQSQPGGWRYEMHLLVLNSGHTSPKNKELLGRAPTTRVACVDVNVSNLSVVSVVRSATVGLGPRDLISTVVAKGNLEQDFLKKAEAKKRRGQKKCDRSRRSTNDSQYQKSNAQIKRDSKRVTRGLKPVETQVPGGARLARADGKPTQAYYRDTLSGSYKIQRRSLGETDRARSLTKQIKAHDIAVQLSAIHGTNWIIEDCNLSTWARLWGKSLHAFAPGMITAELAALATRLGGTFTKVSTTQTALSSHCLCGHAKKKGLSERVHSCDHCGFTGDRDLVSAGLGTCVVLSEVPAAASVWVDYTRAASILDALTSPNALHQGYQDALTSQTHPLDTPRRIGEADQGVRSAANTRWTARHNASGTGQSTKGLGKSNPAKVAYDPALARSSPRGQLRLNS